MKAVVRVDQVPYGDGRDGIQHGVMEHILSAEERFPWPIFFRLRCKRDVCY